MSRLSALALATVLVVAPAYAQTPAPTAQTTVAPASAEAFATASQRVIATMEAISHVEGASPALAVVMVRRGEAPVIWVHGPLDATAQPQVMANADTPFYIASQTKAFVGLMALKLHARGVFSLDQSLADVWPSLTLPSGGDPHAITFRQLLSHQGVIENETLEFRTANTDRVPVRDYVHILSTYSTIRAPGFQYANLSYLLYGAALETQTGRDWRDWLDEEILRPAGMSRTSSRASRFQHDQLPVYHQWLGGADWLTHQGKADAVMHSAGGLVSSPNDMARWLALQLGGAPNVVSPEILAQSQTLQIASVIRGDALDCQGYAVGWNVCHIGEVDVRLHGGAYTAVRSSMGVSPELGVAFAFLSNSDSLTGALSQLSAQIFFATVQDPNWGGPSPEDMQAQLAARLPRLVDGRRSDVAERRAEAQWEGWAWRPTRADLRRYVGRYRSPRLGELRVAIVDGALRGNLGVLTGALDPAKPDLFGYFDGPLDPPSPVTFERDGRRISALTWDNERFERVR